MIDLGGENYCRTSKIKVLSLRKYLKQFDFHFDVIFLNWDYVNSSEHCSITATFLLRSQSPQSARILSHAASFYLTLITKDSDKTLLLVSPENIPNYRVWSLKNKTSEFN